MNCASVALQTQNLISLIEELIYYEKVSPIVLIGISPQYRVDILKLRTDDNQHGDVKSVEANDSERRG